MINSLEERIRRFEAYDGPIGVWRINTIYHTKLADMVESESHEVLSHLAVLNVPFGEVFSCSVEQARSAVGSVLERHGLTDSTKRETLFN
ncbi:MAG: hypothetical protein HN576_04110 [Bacteriovoracaceae bacterium]|jgi:hypothetical protein|nr:hypothetical protein [Bacteriovoracaceae bacterium]